MGPESNGISMTSSHISVSSATSTTSSMSSGGTSGSLVPQLMTGSLNRLSLKLPLTGTHPNFGSNGTTSVTAGGFNSSPSSPSSGTSDLTSNGHISGGVGNSNGSSTNNGPTLPFEHKNPAHATMAFDAFAKMRENNQLCDVIIRVGAEVTIGAHKIILAAISPYFQAMFNDDLAEKSQRTIRIHEIDPDAMEQLVKYAYTGDMLITEDNVQALLPASSLLQMSLVREACCKFLLRQLHPTNCLGIRTFADTHACKELHTRSHRFALQNFPEVMATEEFLVLPLEEVEELLGSNQLNVASEEEAFQAGMAWVRHDLGQRSTYLSRLMSKVRIPLLSRRFLMTTVDSEELIREDSGCKELLLEAMRYHLQPEQRPNLASERTVDRRPDGMRPYIFAVGGGSLFAIHSECECYNPRTDRWMSVAPLATRRSRCGVGSIGRLLYAVGGYDGSSDLASGECYNPRINKWASIGPMGTRRSCLGLCALDGLLYAAGGYDGASCLSSTERYDPLTGVWSCCAALSQRRRYCRLAALEGCVWAVGGLDSTNALAVVERFDPREGKWSSVPSLSQKRSSAGVAGLENCLYVSGGTDGNVSLQTNEKLDPRRLRWENISPMHTKRSTHELVALEGSGLFALGGNDGSNSLSTCERYDPRLNKWTVVSSLLTRRSALGAAVLESLSMDRLGTSRPC